MSSRKAVPAGLCLWDRGCDQARCTESGEYCYYHYKLVTGILSPAPVNKRAPLAADLDRAGASDATVAEADRVEERYANRGLGFLKKGRVVGPQELRGR